MATTYDLICPCCGNPLQLQMIESEAGEISFRLFHYSPEISYVDIQAHGYEFGSIEGGE